MQFFFLGLTTVKNILNTARVNLKICEPRAFRARAKTTQISAVRTPQPEPIKYTRHYLTYCS